MEVGPPLDQANFASGEHDALRKGRLLRALRASGVATMAWCFHEGRLDLSYEASELLGLPKGVPLASFRSLVRQVAPVDRPKVLTWIWDNLSELPNIKTKFELDFRVLHSNSPAGQTWLRMDGEFDPEANQDYVLYFTITDITEQKRAADYQHALRVRDERRLKDLERLTRELQAAQHCAEASVTSQSRFFALISRDIRVPLNSLIGMLSLVDRKRLNAEDVQRLQVADEAAEQLRLLFDDLLDMAQSESGNLVLQNKTCDLTKLVNESCGHWVKAGANDQVTFSVEIDPACPQWINIDDARLKQALDRMIFEAIGYSREGAVRVCVAPSGQDRLRFFVEATQTRDDQLPSSEQSREESAVRQTIIERLAKAMDGESGSSRSGGTVTTWLELACKVEFSPKVPAQVDTNQTPLQRLSLRILVAEDVLTNQMVVEGHLARLGCECVCVPNGKEALRSVTENNFDVVLMDMAMPVLDGASAIRAIRALPDGKGQMPIIALTAYSRPEELEPMLEAGANAAVIKPVDITELSEALKSVVVCT